MLSREREIGTVLDINRLLEESGDARASQEAARFLLDRALSPAMRAWMLRFAKCPAKFEDLLGMQGELKVLLALENVTERQLSAAAQQEREAEAGVTGLQRELDELAGGDGDA